MRLCSVKDNIYRLVRYKKRRLVDSLRFLVYTVGNLRFLVYTVGNPHIPADAHNAKKNPGTLPSKCTGKAIGIRNNVPANVLRLLWLYYKLCDNLQALP